MTTAINQAAAAVACAEAERRAALWRTPILADAEIAEVLNLPESTWAAIKRAGDTPPLFKLGRRLYCRTADLREWIDARAKTREAA